MGKKIEKAEINSLNDITKYTWLFKKFNHEVNHHYLIGLKQDFLFYKKFGMSLFFDKGFFFTYKKYESVKHSKNQQLNFIKHESK